MFETLPLDPKERAMHAGTVHALAQEMSIPDEKVELIYRGELVQLMQTARIRDFLPVLTGRVVKDRLRARMAEAAGEALRAERR